MPASTRGSEARKLPSTAWRPGQSGNPRGRPKAPFDIGALCREHAPEAVATLVAALRDPRHKVAAAEALLNRGFGKPVQPLHSENQSTVLHLIAAQHVSHELIAELKPPPPLAEPQTIDATLPPTE
jgi:hypothetical protein